jgi:hypothetical protein
MPPTGQPARRDLRFFFAPKPRTIHYFYPITVDLKISKEIISSPLISKPPNKKLKKALTVT